MNGLKCGGCGWIGAPREAGEIRGEKFCPNPKCERPFDLEDCRLCVKCHDAEAGEDSERCQDCEPVAVDTAAEGQFRRDRSAA